jgi:NAD(P)-dependent dehydrogenase (short-subunit alcohol dehydrogenase family)
MSRVSGKVALVTGGAMGLGEAIVRLLVREGAKVVLTDVQDEIGQAVADALGAGQALYLHHDVASEADWQSVIAQTLDQFGQLDIVVNNAGVALIKSVEETTLEDWRGLMSVNLDGVFLGTKYGVEAIRRQGRGGSIINLSSIEGIIGDPNLAAYNASKGGVRLLTKSAALHCAKAGYGIRVNSIHPGIIWTPMIETWLTTTGNLEQGRRYLDSLHPIGHIGEPEDIAYGVLYLASEEAKFVTGSELVIDGGYTAQ